ncbi:hypothetical protein BaRGS_00016547, partial [Batillaria attramentaria]
MACISHSDRDDALTLSQVHTPEPKHDSLNPTLLDSRRPTPPIQLKPGIVETTLSFSSTTPEPHPSKTPGHTGPEIPDSFATERKRSSSLFEPSAIH